jgi:cytochrome c oxidase assembly protein subunit 15
MVLIGGITRLTDSGLSMVDWKPIMGAIPPLSETEWLTVFNKYKSFPEYKLVNAGMSLADFKSIFFWEYFHRLFGRIIGLAFLLPYLYFIFTKKVTKSLNKKLLISFVLGGLQGLMGWYMVKSGLVNEPDVSHYRLAAHLGLAFIIIGYLYWVTLSIKYPEYNIRKSIFRNKTILIFTVILIVQIVFGAFVAGLDAGLTHNTFPKMGRVWIPATVYEFIGLDIYLHNQVVVQFIHRCLAWTLLALGLIIFSKRKLSHSFNQKKSKIVVFFVLLIQFILGIFTIILLVPISIASLHQIFACILLLATIRLVFFSTHQVNA